MKTHRYPSVLTIAGSDSSGGAGIQGDLKTISSLGCYATTAITAITVQNTRGVTAIHSIPPEIVKGQIDSIMTDILPDAIKIGMVHSVSLVNAIAAVLQLYPQIPIILDPVMVATSGDKLIEDHTLTAMKEKLFPLAMLITPNLDEASILAGMKINTVVEMHRAGHMIMESGCKNLLLKGGHLQGNQLTSLYFSAGGPVEEFISERIDTNNTHGSGCTLSSAIASFIARGVCLKDAIANAEIYVHEAISSGATVQTGQGNGPLNHFFKPINLIINEMV